MQRIEVKNFGPLKDITLDIKDYMVFIGPQASGKSTLAKLIYFFWEVRKKYRSTFAPTIALNKFLGTGKEDYHWSQNLPSYVRDLFKNRFPLFRNGRISFFYDDIYQIEIDVVLLTSGFEGDIKISESFFSELEKFESAIEDFFPTKNLSTLNKEISFESLSEIITNQLLDTDSYIFFNIKSKVVDTFIPAGRILLSILSNSISFIEKNSLDFYNEEFIKLSNEIRKYISTSNYENLFGWSARLNSEDNVEDIFLLSNRLAFTILKGDFHLNHSGDGIMHYNESGIGFLIPLKNTSSGQQEVSWLINTIHYLLAESMSGNKNEYNTIIEEPETHLFPEAQRDMTYLISLLANQQDSKVLITTHSPYVLASLNNLIKAYLIGQEESKEKSVGELIHPLLWVNPERLYVGYLDNGIIRSIIDEETSLISHEELDGVSVDIMSQFDDLLEIQYA